MSQITLWNKALARLGDEATVSSPQEKSRQAELCRLFYDGARRSVLQMRDWGFATKTRVLSPAVAPLGSDPKWRNIYDYPADAIHLWAVFPAGTSLTVPHEADARAVDYTPDTVPAYFTDFEVGLGDNDDQVIFTNMGTACARFTVDVVDVGRWSPLFYEALSWFLASQVAGPLIQGESGRNESRRMLEEFNLYLNQAATKDANQHSGQARHRNIPSGLKARG
jgi:hypothetical protein